MANLSNINNKFLVTTGGNVLIGQTANDGNRLQITGADGASYIYLKTDVATTGGRIGFNGDDLRVFNQQTSGELNLGTAGTSRVRISNSLVVFPTITELRGDVAAKFAIGNMGGASSQMMVSSRGFLTLNVSNTGSALDATERMRIDSSGNVGIGVVPNAPANGLIQLDVGDNGCGMTSRQNNELILQANANYSTYAQAGKPATRLNLTNSGEFHFLNAPAGAAVGDPITFTERLRIDSSGNVGIGTISPQAALTVAHDLSNGGDATGFRLNAASGTTSNTLFGGPVSSGDYAFFQSYKEGTSAGVRDLSLNPIGGNVGIGTTNPLAINGGAATRLHTKAGVLVSEATEVARFEGGLDGDGASAIVRINTSNDRGLYLEGGRTGVVNFGAIGTTDPSGTKNEAIRIDNTGNVGIGLVLPTKKLEVNSGTSSDIVRFGNDAGGIVFGYSTNLASIDLIASQAFRIRQGSTTPLYIKSDGNVGIGTTLPVTKLHVSNTAVINDAYGLALVENTSTGSGSAANSALNIKSKYGTSQFMQWEDHGLRIGSRIVDNGGTGDIIFTAGSDQEKMRITSGGYLNAGAYTASSNTHHKIVTTRVSSETFRVENNSTTPYGQIIRFGAAAPNTTDNWFLVCEDNAFSRLIIWGNGNVINRNNSYGGYSDIKLKENIVDATPKLDDLMKVKIRNYNLIGDDNKQIGVIAQEIEKVFPSLVENTKEKNSEEITKSVKYSVFVPMLIKAIQELKAEIELLKSK